MVCCKHQVLMKGMNFGQRTNCKNEAVKDGLCTRHQPENIKAREDRRYEEQKRRQEAARKHNLARLYAKQRSKSNG